MNKTKRIVAIVALVLCLVFVLCACEGLEDFLNGLAGTGGGGGVHTITFENTTGSDYDTVDNVNFASVVANNCIATVYEIICFVDYAYTYTGGSSTHSTSSQATAFAINEDGYLVTNAHAVLLDLEDLSDEHNRDVTGVTYNRRSVYAMLADSTVAFACDIVAYDEALDLCVLQIPATGRYHTYNRDSGDIIQTNQSYELESTPYVTFFAHTDPTVEMQNAVNLWYGESVVAIGNAYGYGIAVTAGVVSAPYRAFASEGFARAIQTDTAINSGNSGGPLFNAYCAVVGINTFKLVDVEVDNMAYAIPTYVVLDWMDSLADGSYGSKTMKGGSNGVAVALSGNLEIEYFYTAERIFSSSGQYTFSNFDN